MEEALRKEGITFESSKESAGSFEADLLVDPMLFRVVDDLIRSETEGRGTLQVVQLNVQQEGEGRMWDVGGAERGRRLAGGTVGRQTDRCVTHSYVC